MSLFTDYNPFPPPPERHANMWTLQLDTGVVLSATRADKVIELTTTNDWPGIEMMMGRLTKDQARSLLMWLMENYWEMPDA